MNGLSVSELCCLFCCPPCPSKIVAKLAFLPPQPTYKLIVNGDQTLYPLPPTEQTALHGNGNGGGAANGRSNGSSASAAANNSNPSSNAANNNAANNSNGNSTNGNVFTNLMNVNKFSYYSIIYLK